MWKAISRMEKHHQVLFALFIGFAVVAFWRGAWGVLDTYLLPDNYVLSSWASLLIGLAILAGTHYLPEQFT